MSENETMTKRTWPVTLTVTESRTFTAYVAADSQAMAELYAGLIDVEGEAVRGNYYLDELAEVYGDFEMGVAVAPSKKLFGGPAVNVGFDEEGEAEVGEVNGCPVLDLRCSGEER